MKTDEKLIEETLNGQTAAFGELVRRYQDRLYTTLFHFVECAEDAEDVTQEAFVQAYLKLATFRGHSRFYTWLYRIAFNLAHSRLRRKKWTISLDDGAAAEGSEYTKAEDAPTSRAERAEEVTLIREALHLLQEDHRTILLLREMEGLDYQAISDILDLPLGTVRSRLCRARLQLREQLCRMLPEKASEP